MAQDEVKIGYLGFVLALPTFVALEKGYFQEQGLKVTATLFESGTIITDALITGRIDVNDRKCHHRLLAGRAEYAWHV